MNEIFSQDTEEPLDIQPSFPEMPLVKQTSAQVEKTLFPKKRDTFTGKKAFE
jgi:hypothetical protein